MPKQRTVNQESAAEFDAIIVGAGVSGLYALHRLRGIGLNAVVFEAGGNVGGTWFWNRYPGCRCDVESMEYSYSFCDKLQQEWHWPERYGTQPQILEYINHFADRLDLRRDIRFDTRILAASFDDSSNRWILETDRHGVVSAPICIMATGNLSTPQVPDFPGLDTFKGKWYHTGLWPHEGVDFSGLRVGIIGTGASGVQSIPHIAEQASHLHVFQRTANFSLPARNGAMDPGKERRHKAEYPARRLAAYDTPFGIAGHPPPEKSALEDTPAEREAVYESKWAEGGSISFLYAYNDLLVNKEANDTASEFVRNKIRQTVKDPVVAELLAPKSHPIGTKRLILDTNYYETYNRDNVSLVDIASASIEAITPSGLRTAQAQFAFDAIVFATGFDAITGALLDIDLQGAGGARLKDKWADGPRSYLGMMMAGFPNMFLITGPQSPSVKAQMILAAEQHTNWIVDLLKLMKTRGMARVEATQAAENRWVQHNNDVADSTLYPLANSWYMGANIPGKPRIFMPYVGGFDRYKRNCDEIAATGYEGCILTPAATASAAE